MPTQPKRRAARPSRLEWLHGAPAWLSALAAVMGTFIAAAALFGWFNRPQPTSLPVPPNAPAVVAPAATPEARVTIDSVLVQPPDVAANGGFENLDSSIEEVLFVGRPVGVTDEQWVAVSATLSPSATSGPLQSGHWSASRPAPSTSAYRWRAIVWPRAPGAAGDDDLRNNGPDSLYVIAVSEEWSAP